MEDATPEAANHRERHLAVHRRAALTHEEAATAHYLAAEFFEQHGQPDMAARERDLGDKETARAESDWRELGE